MVEQVPRDVGEHDAASGADPFDRFERDQAVPGTDVEHDVSRGDPRLLEHAVPDRDEVLEGSPLLLGVVAVSAVEQPRGPSIQLL